MRLQWRHPSPRAAPRGQTPTGRCPWAWMMHSSLDTLVQMQSEPNTEQSPFRIDVADRVKRLPPYLFGKINSLKYQKRRAGIDVIDLGMGNPTDVPDPQIVDKLCEAARDNRNHRY